MRIAPEWLILSSLLIPAPMALADAPATQPAGAQSAAPDLEGLTPRDRKALMRKLRDEREKRVRERGQIFARIAVDHDYRGEYVLYRDEDVTAFLDLKDPQHPRFPGPAGASRSVAHILVVPNQPRESIGKTLSANISADDLEETLKVMQAASALATRLGIKNPQIYVKSPERVGVGYLHVHIDGERDPAVPYPPPLK